ncbi:hypothetical protein FRC03_001204 [Tulasnella sp. 419]|nr:hypothetical protein FRC03_001204 [Tulasnella sp. 419]
MRHQLGKAAYTGIAATVIGGETLHSFAMLSLGNREPSAQTLKELAEKLSSVAYLIIDETSMISRPFLAKLSHVIQRAKAAEEKDDTCSFGGMNVIIARDFHQFPPVASKPNAHYTGPTGKGTQRMT